MTNYVSTLNVLLYGEPIATITKQVVGNRHLQTNLDGKNKKALY